MQSDNEINAFGTSLRPGDLVDERVAATILSVSIQTLRNWRWARKGPRARKVGQRLVRYHRTDLADFIAGDVAKDGSA